MLPNKRLKVLVVYHSAARESSKAIFKSLAARGEVKLRVLGPRKGYDPWYRQVLEIAKPYRCEYEMVPGRVYKPMDNFSGPYLTALSQEMWIRRPDVIHVFDEAMSALYFQALLYRNLLLPRGKVLFHGFDNMLSAPRSRRGRLAWEFICRHGDGGTYSNSEGLEQVAALGYPSEHLVLAYWGVSVGWISESRNSPLRQKLGIDGKFVIGHVGRLQEEKGVWTILHALRHLPESVHWLCIGDGPGRDAFLARVDGFGVRQRVHWIPWIPSGQVPEYMGAMDALVLASETTPGWKEQFGRVLPEAMACGLPIIGSDSGAIPEIVDGAGLIFAERDPVELMRVIDILRKNPRLCRQLGDIGLRRARTHFSCEAFAEKLTNLYLSVTGAK